jgi:hypothetical protein
MSTLEKFMAALEVAEECMLCGDWAGARAALAIAREHAALIAAGLNK